MTKQLRKHFSGTRGPVNISTKMKLSIYETFKNTGNKSATAIQFGVSPRTIGRVIHELDEHNLKPQKCDAKLSALEAELKKLRELINQLVQVPQPTVVYIRHRQRPDMDLLNLQVEKVQDNHYANPYRHCFVGSSYVEISGIPTLQIRYSSQPQITPDFLLRHPVSPDCKVYPYAAIGKIMPSDPQEGKHCDCQDCRDWRYLLGKQKQMELSREAAAGDYAVFHGSKLRER